MTLEGEPKLCGNSYKWDYINEEDANSATFFSTLLAAKATGANVRLYTTKTGSNEYCKIGYMRVN